jgi:hypothetical protein
MSLRSQGGPDGPPSHACALRAHVVADEAGFAGCAAFARLFEVVPSGVVLTDSAGRIVLANPEFCRLFGYHPGETTGRDLSLLTAAGPGGPGPVAAGAPGDAPAEAVVRRRDGSLFRAAVRSVAVDVGGESLSRLVVFEARENGPVAALPGPAEDTRLAAHDAWGESNRWHRIVPAARAALENGLDLQERLGSLARFLVPLLGDSCIVYLREGSEGVRRAHVALADPGLEKLLLEQLTHYPPSLDRLVPPVANSLRTGESQLIPEISIAALKAVPGDREHVSVALLVGLTSLIVVALRAGDEVVGAISVGMAESGRRFHADDLALLEQIARDASSLF